MKIMKTTEQFIIEAKQIHGDRYDYSKVVYTGKDNKIIIYCKIHGEFEQRPNSHLRGMNCKKCSVLEGSAKQRSNNEEFIKKAREMHGDRYDYSKVEYTNSKNNITIICKIHGDFLQEPHTHLTGCGCKKCGNILRGENRKFTNEEFIEKIKEIHGDTYDYSKVQYTGIYNEIIIICKKHGEIKQNANTHLRGHGCKKCADILRGEKRKFTNCEFIKKSKEIHGDRYDYEKVNYTGCDDKVIIICKKHGEFEQTANTHLHGSGCNLCGNEQTGNHFRHDNTVFIMKAIAIHKDKYDYSKVEYTGIDNKIIIVCKIHGEFEQIAYSHINGQGCPTCGKIKNSIQRTSCTDEFIEKSIKIHGNIYDYSSVEYKKSDIKISIICRKHGEFSIKPGNHMQGQGCPLCINKTEGKLYINLIQFFPSLQKQFKQQWCKKIFHLPFDFCIPEYKIIIELDGRQHFQQVRNWSSPQEQQENDKFKEECANNNGYSVIRLLQEDVFHDTYDWVKELCDAIEQIKSSNEITNIYLSKNNEYDNF